MTELLPNEKLKCRFETDLIMQFKPHLEALSATRKIAEKHIEEFMQTGLILVWYAYKKYDIQKSKLSTWICFVVGNLIDQKFYNDIFYYLPRAEYNKEKNKFHEQMIHLESVMEYWCDHTALLDDEVVNVIIEDKLPNSLETNKCYGIDHWISEQPIAETTKEYLRLVSQGYKLSEIYKTLNVSRYAVILMEREIKEHCKYEKL